MKVADVMTAPVVTVEPETTVERALELLEEWQFRHLPVVANETLIGIVSDRDLEAARIGAAPGEAGPTIHAIMHRSVVTVAPEASVEEAGRKMAEHKIGALPVLNGRQLVGMVTETDLLRLVGRDLGRVAGFPYQAARSE